MKLKTGRLQIEKQDLQQHTRLYGSLYEFTQQNIYLWSNTDGCQTHSETFRLCIYNRGNSELLKRFNRKGKDRKMSKEVSHFREALLFHK